MSQGIWDYTWLFAVGAATLGVLYILPKLLSSNEMKPIKASFRSPYRRTPVGVLSVQQLSEYNGEGDENGRILISICGRILDMSRGRDFYGPQGAYHVFAGCDATYLLGAMSVEVEGRNKRNFGQWDQSWVSEYSSSHPGETIPYCDSGAFSKETLEGWLSSFVAKYPVVGKLRGYMDVCEESWKHVTQGADLAPGYAADENEAASPPIKTWNELDQSKCISIGGNVFDVSVCSYVYAPTNGDFPGALGHDISVAIIKDDFSEKCLDQPIVPHLDSSEQVRLQLLVRKFCDTYPRVAILKDAFKYQMVEEENVSEEKNAEEKVSEEKNSEEQKSISDEPQPQSQSQAATIPAENKEAEISNNNSNNNNNNNSNNSNSNPQADARDRENDGEWDFVQHSDVMSQNER